MHLQALLLPTLVTPFVLYLALLAQRRAGPEAAGLVAALPVQLAIGGVGVAMGLGNAATATFGLVASTYLAAQVAYGVAFATGVRKGGASIALLGSLGTYALLTLLLHAVAPAIAAGVGAIALIIGTRAVQPSRQAAGSARSGAEVPAAVTIALSTIVVLAVLVLVQFAGPQAGGFLAAVPVMSSTLSLVLLRSHGRQAAATTMGGMIRGLPAYYVFALAMALFAQPLGAVGAGLLGLALSLSTAGMTWRFGMGRERSLSQAVWA